MAQTPSTEPNGSGSTWLQVVVLVLILAGLVLTSFFGIRLIRSAQQLHHIRPVPQLTDVSLIRGWMTVPYISRAYRVPENLLWQGLGIPEAGNRRKSLRTLDQQYAGGQPGVVLDKVVAIVRQYEAEHPTTPIAPTISPLDPTLTNP